MKTVAAHMETAAECIPTKPRGKFKVPWELLVVGKKKSILFFFFKLINANAQKV